MKFSKLTVNEQRRKRTPGLELDVELARGVSRGDKESLERLVKRHASVVYRYVQRRLPPGETLLAQEITGAVFRRALRRISSYARGTTYTTMDLWLLRLAGQEVQKRLKTLPNEVEAYVHDPTAELRSDLRSLKPAQQQSFALALFQELEPGDIAASLGTTTSKAMKLLRKSLKGMRREGESWS
ncbi:MAG: hypothetical protein M3014_10390 [Chloroflexota bacterium]|nr:hypothetical protein [Chloroflexota bacterium]